MHRAYRFNNSSPSESLRLCASALNVSTNFPRAFFQRFFRLQFNPFQVFLGAEPRQLPLGELPSADFHQLDGFRQWPFAAQMLRHLPVADGLHRRFVFGEAALEQFACLVHQTAREHGVHAGIDTSVQVNSGAREAVKVCFGRDGASTLRSIATEDGPRCPDTSARRPSRYIHDRGRLCFCARTGKLHPDNRHVKDKIHQQLQALRDAEPLLHVERGEWRLP